MTEGFMFKNADEAMEFFEACEVAGAYTLEARMSLMRQWVKIKKVGYIPHPEEWVKGKNVLRIKTKEDLNND